MTDDSRSSAHQDLVKALGDEQALGDLSGAWLESVEWADAIERFRAQRFPNIPPDEAFRAVGRHLGESYLGSDVGKLLLQSLRLMPPERVFATVAPAMAPRLRPGFTWHWEPGTSGGVLRIRGKRVTPSMVTLGFFEAMTSPLSARVTGRLGRVAPEELELVFSW